MSQRFFQNKFVYLYQQPGNYKETGFYAGLGIPCTIMNVSRFIACGMYAPNEDIKHAWQVLFDRFYPLVDLGGPFEHQLVFDSDESVLRAPDLVIGHTCGYPLMTRLQDALMPVCLPCFDVPGASAKLYSSQFIVPANSTIDSLQQCQGKVVAINNSNSNSGMNVLRYALAKLGTTAGFFSEVLMSGGHLASIEAVATNRAQLAAIDCVTYQLIADQNPALMSAVRIIGYSEQTCGLPFVVPRSRYSQQLCDNTISAFNQALTELPSSARTRLHLDHFESVCLDDYQSILELENLAIEAGYAELN